MTWLEKFLVNLALAVLERYIAKGSAAAKALVDLQKELKANEEKSKKYSEVVKNPNSTREERRRAEDDLLG